MDRPALSYDIEITPEMFAAGWKALSNVEGEAYDVIIPQVFRAMIAVSNFGRCLEVPD